MGFVDTLDRTQRKRSFLGFPVATFFKFIDDQGPYLSAIISFYALIAIFPLLLLATTIFGFILQGNPEFQERVLDSALEHLPDHRRRARPSRSVSRARRSAPWSVC